MNASVAGRPHSPPPACCSCRTLAPSARQYQRPDMPAPAAFKEALPAGWKDAQPNDGAPRGTWWSSVQRPGTRCARRSGQHFEPECAGRRGTVPSGRGFRAHCPSGSIPRRQHVADGVTHGRHRIRGGSQPVHAPDRCDVPNRHLGKYPAQRDGECGHRSGIGRRSGECQVVVPDGARRRLLPASGTRRRGATARRHREVVRAIRAADQGSIRRRCRLDGRRGPGADTVGDRTRRVGRSGRSAGPVRARDCRADGQAPLGIVDARRSGPIPAAAPARRTSVDAPRATARRRRRRAAGCGRERTDRHRQGGILPFPELRRQRRLASLGHRRFAHGADTLLVRGRATGRDALRRGQAPRAGQADRGRPTTPPSRTTGRSC